MVELSKTEGRRHAGRLKLATRTGPRPQAAAPLLRKDVVQHLHTQQHQHTGKDFLQRGHGQPVGEAGAVRRNEHAHHADQHQGRQIDEPQGQRRCP
ncbi:hypothetical protein SDC9_198569 [bioreactor metagenome]|uniref:Uncharacterized protein n=1 Tax=bioreactor metagenome TaxID=1076179 RepID=A0A645IKD6_9ZZZZ